MFSWFRGENGIVVYLAMSCLVCQAQTVPMLSNCLATQGLSFAIRSLNWVTMKCWLQFVRRSLPSKDRGLHDYQIEGVEWLLGNEFGILADDDMGLGKTLQLLMAMLISMELSCVRVAWWSVPASLVYNWYAEIKYWLPELEVKIVKGKAKRKRKSEEIVDLVVPSQGQIVIVNYKRLPKILADKDKDKDKDMDYQN